MAYTNLTTLEKKAYNKAAYARRKAYYDAYRERNAEKLQAAAHGNNQKRYWANPQKYRDKQKLYYQENREQCLERHKKYDRKKYMTSTEERRKKQILKTAKSRAKDKNIPFAITISDFTLPTHCPLIGLELDYSMPKGYHPNHPSIDRIIPSLGYVVGNVWIISRRANVMKNDASLEELQMFSDNLKAHGIIK